MLARKASIWQKQRDSMSFAEHLYWNERAYGNAVRVPARALQAAFVVGCIITPFTNWMIPFSQKIIKKGLVVRY